jgi:hypothetical protein
MHFLPDTDDEDAAAERPWPDNFKKVIRNELPAAFHTAIDEASFKYIYQRSYSSDYRDLDHFVERVINMAVIGAENGADRGFDAVYQAFLDEKPLPEARPYARFLWPHFFSETLKQRIHRAIADDYRQDEEFQYAYEAGYAHRYNGFEEFIDEVARVMLIATENGVDDMLSQIYRAFLAMRPLPPARRNPKRLKQY